MFFSPMVNQAEVPGGMLGAPRQWYARPELQPLLKKEMEAMLPYVGQIRWGVNVGTLPDGRMFWRVRQPIKANRVSGRGTLYNNVYDILLVYDADHPKSVHGTSIRAYLEGPHDLNWLQSRVNRSLRSPKYIPHVLKDQADGSRYLCTSHYNNFSGSFDDPRGVASAKTSLLCAIKWLHNYECGLLSQAHWKKFHEHGAI